MTDGVCWVLIMPMGVLVVDWAEVAERRVPAGRVVERFDVAEHRSRQLGAGVVHATTGEIIRALTIDVQRRYHGTGKPPGGPKGPREPKRSEPK
jgi:hypothetical protein